MSDGTGEAPRDKVAVISGGASGIGLAMARQLAGEGYKVIACGRDKARLERMEQEIPGSFGWACDVASREDVQVFAAAVMKEYPAIDLLVPNAGISQEIDFGQDLTDVDYTAELRVNVEGVLHLITAFMPALKASAPSAILVVGSGYGLAPTTRAPIYCASKAALHSLCKSLGRQLAPYKIQVTELLPSRVDTPMVGNTPGDKMKPEYVAARGLAGVRKGAPTVYAGQVAKLAFMMRLAPSVAENIAAKT